MRRSSRIDKDERSTLIACSASGKGRLLLVNPGGAAAEEVVQDGAARGHATAAVLGNSMWRMAVCRE